jgi:hypothetical protein
MTIYIHFRLYFFAFQVHFFFFNFNMRKIQTANFSLAVYNSELDI